MKIELFCDYCKRPLEIKEKTINALGDSLKLFVRVCPNCIKVETKNEVKEKRAETKKILMTILNREL